MGFSTIGGAGGGSEETPSGGAGSAEHAGVDDQSSSNDDQITIKDTEVVINEDHDAEMNFRVEGDAKTHLLFVDSSTDRVGINTDTPGALFEIEAGGLDNTEAFAITEGGVDRLAVETDFATGSLNNRAILKSDAVNPIMTIETTSGNIGVGTLIPDSLFEVVKASADAEVLISCYHNTEATTPKITFRKADNTEASPALVDDNAVLGTIDFLGHDGTNFERGAKIEARVQGTSANNDLPTELTFWTTPDGSNTAAERMSIGADGAVALKSLSAVPAITTGYSKLFAKSDIGLDTAVLMHFENNWNDAGVWGLAAGTASGDPTFVTSSPAPVFGTYCAYFDGTGDFVDLDGDSDDPALGLGYDDWTIDFWISFPSGALAANQIIIQSGATEAGSAEGSWRINLGQTSSAGDSISFDAGSGFADLLTWDYGSEIVDDKTWYHFAMVQHGGTVSFFLNGTKKASAENTNRLYTYGGVRIGAAQDGSIPGKFYMDELRISKKAQWVNNFTRPTVAYGDSTLQCIDAHGNHTRLSPHNAQGEWEYFSHNSITKKTVRINMEEVVRDLGRLTGKDYIKDE